MGEVFKLNHCYNMDCLPAMELFPDNYFDLAVVDPPYFSGPERRGFYGSKVSKIGVHRDYPVSPAWMELFFRIIDAGRPMRAAAIR